MIAEKNVTILNTLGLHVRPSAAFAGTASRFRSSVSVIKDRDTGRSKGFAFVEMTNDDEAQKAISQFNGAAFQERSLKVNVARPREDRPRGAGGGGGGGGGFGGPRGGGRGGGGGGRGGGGRSW